MMSHVQEMHGVDTVLCTALLFIPAFVLNPASLPSNVHSRLSYLRINVTSLRANVLGISLFFLHISLSLFGFSDPPPYHFQSGWPSFFCPLPAATYHAIVTGGAIRLEGLRAKSSRRRACAFRKTKRQLGGTLHICTSVYSLADARSALAIDIQSSTRRAVRLWLGNTRAVEAQHLMAGYRLALIAGQVCRYAAAAAAVAIAANGTVLSLIPSTQTRFRLAVPSFIAFRN